MRRKFRDKEFDLSFDVDPNFGGAEWDQIAEWCIQNVRETDTFIDIGANVGFIARMVMEFTKAKDYHFIEPNAVAFKHLVENALPTSTLYHSIVITDSDKPVYFYSNENSALSSIIKRPDLKVSTSTKDGLSLTSFVKNRNIEGDIVLKIDAEFSEPEIWKGMQEILPQVRAFIMELDRKHLEIFTGVNPIAFERQIRDAGFRVEQYNSNNIIAYRDNLSS